MTLKILEDCVYPICLYQSTVQTENAQELLLDCLSLDEVIQEILENTDDRWEPVVQRLQSVVLQEEYFRKKLLQCLNCGALFMPSVSDLCQICGFDRH